MEQQRISLSLADVRHLQAQFAKEATDKLDLYLPTTDTSDPLKHRVGALVNDFIYEIFESAKASMEIDGVDPTVSLRSLLDNPTHGVQKEVEPFDFSLQEQVRKLYQEVEEETINLTNLRRTTPQSLKKTYEDTFNQSMERLTQLQAEIEAAEEEHESPNDHGAKFSLLKPRLEDMITEYSQSIREIKEIKDNIPRERSELEKLGQIMKFLSEKH